MIKAHNLHPTLREEIRGIPRRKFHVCKDDAENADYLYNSIDSGMLFHTVLDALAVAQDYDEIIVWPGQYKETAAIAIDQPHLKLTTALIGPNKAFTQTEIRQYGNVEAHCITIEAHGVEVSGFRITPYGGTTYRAITVAQAANCYGCYLHDNYFYAAEQTGGILTCGSASFNADSIAVMNNEFWKGGNAGDQATRAAILMTKAYKHLFAGNTITQIGNTQQFLYLTDEISNSKILDNRFWAVEAGAVAIYNGTSTLGDYFIDGNSFGGYADTAHCISGGYSTLSCGVNWREGNVIIA